MNINQLITLCKQPPLYEPGNAVMWIDSHISQELLKAHLDPNHDAASRRPESIDRIVTWMKKQMKDDAKKILDLGCGPGLYCEKFAEEGFDVTGIDFSSNSIDYANTRAKQKALKIDYIHANYLEYQLNDTYDLIYIIFCDFGVLSLVEQILFLSTVYQALNDGGTFILDVYNEGILKVKSFNNDWEASLNGFWSPTPYVCLSQSFHYPKNKLMLDQHLVIDEHSNIKVYRFWEHYFHEDDMIRLLNSYNFKNIKKEIVLDANPYVTFYVAKK